MSNNKIGEIIYKDEDIIINADKSAVEIIVTNNGDRPIQVGSHYHFFECNFALNFDREKAFGLHLNIPSGTAIRFEPGEDKKVTLVPYSGDQIVMGFNGITMGNVNDENVKKEAISAMKKKVEEV